MKSNAGISGLAAEPLPPADWQAAVKEQEGPGVTPMQAWDRARNKHPALLKLALVESLRKKGGLRP